MTNLGPLWPKEDIGKEDIGEYRQDWKGVCSDLEGKILQHGLEAPDTQSVSHGCKYFQGFCGAPLDIGCVCAHRMLQFCHAVRQLDEDTFVVGQGHEQMADLLTCLGIQSGTVCSFHHLLTYLRSIISVIFIHTGLTCLFFGLESLNYKAASPLGPLLLAKGS